jgi:hypothetical protein
VEGVCVARAPSPASAGNFSEANILGDEFLFEGTGITMTLLAKV